MAITWSSDCMTTPSHTLYTPHKKGVFIHIGVYIKEEEQYHLIFAVSPKYSRFFPPPLFTGFFHWNDYTCNNIRGFRIDKL